MSTKHPQCFAITEWYSVNRTTIMMARQLKMKKKNLTTSPYNLICAVHEHLPAYTSMPIYNPLTVREARLVATKTTIRQG